MNAGAELFRRETAWEIVHLMNDVPCPAIELPTPRALEDPELRAGYAAALRQFCGWLGAEVTSIAYPERTSILAPEAPIIPKFPRISIRFWVHAPGKGRYN